MTTALWIFVITMMALDGIQNIREKPPIFEVLFPNSSNRTKQVANLLLGLAMLGSAIYLWKVSL